MLLQEFTYCHSLELRIAVEHRVEGMEELLAVILVVFPAVFSVKSNSHNVRAWFAY